jgi:hypothetical protein
MKLPPTNRAVADKLKIVFSSDDLLGDTADAITGTLDDLASTGRATKLSTQQKGYRNRYRVPITDDDALIVEINPNRPKHTEWAMTWEYNPAHLRTKSQRQAMRDVAREILGTDSKRLLSNVSIYLIHIAVDFPGKLDDIAIESRDKSSCGAWGKRFHANGRLQTLYFGSSETDHHQTAYSKSDEMLAALARKPRTTLSQVTAAAKELTPQFRLEDRQRLTRCPVPLHRLDDLREPFAGFHIYSYDEADEHITDTLGRMTLALAKSEGLQRAIQLLSKSERETFRKKLARCQVEWWDAALYLSAVRKTLSATGLFSDSAFDVDAKTGQQVENRYQMRKGRAAKRSTGPDYSLGLDDEDDDNE